MITKDLTADVMIIGAGAVGAACCAALAGRGLHIIMIDEGAHKGAPSVRTSAVSNRSLAWLASLGLPRDQLEPAPLRALQVLDASGSGRLRFASQMQNQDDLGVIVNHDRLEQALRERARSFTDVKWHNDAAARVSIGDDHAHATLKSGHTVRASLLIAADGLQSTTREQLGVSSLQYRYDQTAVCADIHLGTAHEGVAWQRFLTTGPVALLPLPDPLRASLIWSTTTVAAQGLRELSDRDFAHALNEAFGDYLGPLKTASPRAYFPLVAAHAQRYVGRRFALIGDAAHRVHPLAGQGVNLGFADAEVLTQALLAARAHHQDPSALRVLRSYERARKGANISMLLASDLLNRAFRKDNPLIRQLLVMGLNVTDTLNPIKGFFMAQAGGYTHP